MIVNKEVQKRSINVFQGLTYGLTVTVSYGSASGVVPPPCLEPMARTARTARTPHS